ncbi:hypothetical protein JCM3766R1_007079 [Sporobolomyces carnicolor]
MDSTARPTSNTDTCVYDIDFAAPDDQPDRLRELSTAIAAFTNSLSSNYLWHKQPFNLELTSIDFAAPIGKQQHQWLHGKTDVTDAVDDEWFIVYLLQQVSTKWQEAVISIEDDDGEFLLIEAADVLPNWVTPQNAQNRLWIYQGHLHLVPLEHKSDLPFASGEKTLNPSFDPDDDGFIDRSMAVALVRNPSVDTRAPVEVEEVVWARISGYPKKAEEHHHQTLTYLPSELALALEDSPHLITEAVGAFYERDPSMLKACNTMSRFPPSSPLAPSAAASSSTAGGSSPPSIPATVLVPTRLTRPLYSQLLLQKFYAPKPFEKVGWNEGKLGDEDVRRRDLGMKIACGFEMLYKQTAPLPRLDSGSAPAYDPSTNPEYQRLLKSLQEKGFFDGVGIEGSREWTERERNARKAWTRNRGNSPKLSFAQRVDEAIARARSRPDALSDRIESPATLTEDKFKALGLEDSEAWLEIDQAGFEEILRSREGGAGTLEEEGFSDSEDDASETEEHAGVKSQEERDEERKNRRAAKQLEAMAGKVEDFVQGRGAVQGAVFDDERSDDDDDNSDDDEDEDEHMEMPTMSTEERASRLENLVAPLPISEWGQQTPSISQSTETAAKSSVPGVVKSGAQTPHKDARPAKFEAEKYDGASSDSDSSDEAMPGEEGLAALDEEDGERDEDEPSVMDEDAMLDMGEEMDEFLKFATETLGLSEEQYQGILGERRQRGAFVPGPAKEKKTNVVPSRSEPAAKSSTGRTHREAAAPAPSSAAAAPSARQPSRNPNLADFDSLMEQMEKELSHVKRSVPNPASTPRAPKASSSSSASSKPANPTTSSASNKVTIESLSDSDDDDEDDEDVERMDAELQEMLKDMGGDGEGGTMDYNLVKNFLDSFQSQGGFAGPAGNLSGRLGFNLPKNTQ